MVVYTIGHSTRTVGQLASMLRAHHVDTLVDVRAFPRSRTNPQFNIDTLPRDLEEAGIGYTHIAPLGGRRARAGGAAPARGRNDGWRNASFRNYADHARTAAFALGLEELLRLAADRTCAIMCSEAVWWRCHRRIIADYLIARGVTVRHIMGEGRADEATLTPIAVVGPDGLIDYPATDGDAQAPTPD